MKNILKILAVLLFSAILFNSCEKDEPDLTFGGPYFIAFEDASLSQSESNASVIEIIVILSAPAQNSAVTVTFAKSSPDTTAVEGTDFEVLNATETLTFAPGVYTDTVFVTITDNYIEDGAKTIEIELLSSNVADFELGLPGEADANKAFTISVVDDDCAFTPENFSGTPAGTDFGGNPAAVQFTVDATWPEASASKQRYAVTGLMTGQFGVWGETTTAGGTFYLILDYTNPLAPVVTIDLPVGETGHYVETDDGDWGYLIYDREGQTNTFSTCAGTLIWYYWIDLYQNGSIYGGGSGVQYYNGVLDVTFDI